MTVLTALSIDSLRSIHLPTSPLKLLLLIIGIWLLYRVLIWQLHLRLIRKSMPGVLAVPVLLQPWSLIRRPFPKKWQTYHSGWQFQRRKSFKYGSPSGGNGGGKGSSGTGQRDLDGGDFVTLVPLFGDTVVFCFNARAIEEIATSPGRFPKNLSMYSTFPKTRPPFSSPVLLSVFMAFWSSCILVLFVLSPPLGFSEIFISYTLHSVMYL
jgi:hypothetical protein